MKTIIVLLALLSLNAIADAHYKCYSVQQYRTGKEASLTLTTGLFSNKIVAAELHTKIKGNFVSTETPFDDGSATMFEIDQDTMNAAAGLNYKTIEQAPTSVNPSEYKITLSESILNLKETGYAYYYGKQCWWIMDCFTNSQFYKCDKI